MDNGWKGLGSFVGGTQLGTSPGERSTPLALLDASLPLFLSSSLPLCLPIPMSLSDSGAASSSLQAFFLLRKDDCNFFRDLAPATAQEIRHIMVSMVRR